jgi:hypothetical protein
MKITEIGGSSAYQAYLQLALDDAVAAYQVTHEAVSAQPPLTEETATPQLTLLYYRLEQQRATALLLAACCVEALGNLYLAHKSTPEQFAILEWAKFLDKWTVLPSLFVGLFIPEGRRAVPGPETPELSPKRSSASEGRDHPWRLGGPCGLTAGSADHRFCGPRLSRSSYRHRAVFYRGVETPASFSFRAIFLYRRAPAQAAREIHPA